jgi:alpha-aminoadipate carrier protein LysW
MPELIHAAACPECALGVDLPDGAQPTQILVCPGCRAELEVLALQPAVLGLAPEPEEDWGE